MPRLSVLLSVYYLLAKRFTRGEDQSKTPFFFVKTHKTGSSTVAALLRRGAWKRGYRCFVPPVQLAGHVWSWKAPILREILEVEVDHLQKRARNKSQGLVRFDCWTVHAVLSPELVSNVMTVRSPLVIISVRDPLRRVLSAWNHYRPKSNMTFETWVDDAQRKKKLGGPGSDANADYEYADEDPHLSFNAMTAQLLPGAFVGVYAACSEMQKGGKALSMIICRVQGGDWAVVVLERLEESLVVLQRRLGWSDAPFLLQEKRKENVAIPTFSFLPLNRGRDHADYQELVLSMAKSTAETSAAKPPTKQDHVEVLSEHPQAKSNIAAAVRSLAWRDMMLYTAAIQALDDALQSTSLWESESLPTSTNISKETMPSGEAFELGARVTLAVNELAAGSRRLRSSCGATTASQSESSKEEAEAEEEEKKEEELLQECIERQWSDVEWAYHRRAKQDISRTADEASSPFGIFSNRFLEATAQAMPLEADCVLRNFPMEDDDRVGVIERIGEEGRDKLKDAPSRLLCVAAHYEEPHGVFSSRGRRLSEGNDEDGGKSITFQLPVAVLQESDAKNFRQGCNNDDDFWEKRNMEQQVAVVSRGGCAFAEKAAAAERAGFGAVLIIDRTSRILTPPMIANHTGSPATITIPVFMMLLESLSNIEFGTHIALSISRRKMLHTMRTMISPSQMASVAVDMLDDDAAAKILGQLQKGE